MKVRWKKIFLNERHTKYCIVKLYNTKLLMQQAYKEFKSKDDNHYKVLGVHCPYEKFNGNKLSKETGTVFLNLDHCGAGIVCHELAHAVLWAHKHKRNKKQYPIVLKNMKDEEVVLHNLTGAIAQFYAWYWTIESKFSK